MYNKLFRRLSHKIKMVDFMDDVYGLDVPTIEEIVDDIGYDVLDSILEDSSLGDADLDNTLEMFRQTLEASPDFIDDLSNNVDVSIEEFLEPITLDEETNSLDSTINVTHSLKTEDKSIDTGSLDDLKSDISESQYAKIYMESNKSNASFKSESHNLDQWSLNKVTHKLNTGSNVHLSPTIAPQITITQRRKSTDDTLVSPRNEVKESKLIPLAKLDGNQYRDLSTITDQEAVANINYDNMTGRTKELFPVKLHKLIEYSERYGFSSIISWMPHGRSFKIHDEDAFVKNVMPYFFYQTKITSFVRQLRMYGFHKIKGKSNADRGSHYHELFLRSRSGLCDGIIRLDKPRSIKMKDEPNFYRFNPMPSPNQMPEGDNPRCIRYYDPPTHSHSPSNDVPTNLTTGFNLNCFSRRTVSTNGPTAVDRPIPLPQSNQSRTTQPQLGDSANNAAQFIYVFMGNLRQHDV